MFCSISAESCKHRGHGTNLVTRNLPSDVCTKRVPKVGYQSSNKISMWSTANANNCAVDSGVHSITTSSFSLFSDNSVLLGSNDLITRDSTGKCISKIEVF